jgi:hypothetical protein
LCTNTHRFKDRIDVLCVKLRRSKKIDERRAKKRRAVVNKIRLLAPSGQVKIVPSAVVGKGNSVKIELGHQQTSDPGQNEGSATHRQQALNETCGHHEAKSNGPPPDGSKFLEQIEMGVRVSGNVFLHKRHTNVETSNAVGIVTRLNDAHQVVVHDQRGGFGSAQVLTQWKFNHVFALEGQNRRSSYGKRPCFLGFSDLRNVHRFRLNRFL